MVLAAHASVDPTERFRWAAGNNVKGWDYLLGKGYSSFSQQSVDNVRAMEVAVGDPTKNDASGLTLIVGDVNTGTDFKFLQTLRTNLALDAKLPLGIIGTFEALYSRNINGYIYYDVNKRDPNGTFSGVDTRPRYPAGTLS